MKLAMHGLEWWCRKYLEWLESVPLQINISLFLATSFAIVVWQQTGNVWQSGPGLVAIIQMWHHSEEPDVSGNQIKLRPATIATKHYTSPMEQE